MAQSEGFKHITVTAPEDDDVVIMAGMASDAESADGPDEGQSGNLPDETAAKPVLEEPAVKQPAEPDKPKATQQAKRQPSRKKDDYREATLDDLKPAPMPMAQRIVIIAAVICIIGAVIYCLAFIR